MSKSNRLFEIQMGDRFFYETGRTAAAAAEKVRRAFGGHFSYAFPTGRVKFKGRPSR